MAKKFSTAILFELPCFTGGELGIRTPGSFWEHDISSLLCNCDGDVRFSVVSDTPVPAETRMKSGFFATKALQDGLF